MKNTLLALARATFGAKDMTEAAKRVSLAQAILESGRGTSDLFMLHQNPYGIKYRARIASIATPVTYVASDGVGNYAAFASLADAVAGYNLFIRTGPYAAPVDDSAEAYLGALVDGGYATDPGYEAKVTALLHEADTLLAEAAASNNVALPGAQSVLPVAPFRLGVVVGHNTKAMGAYAEAPLSESEFVFNTDVAEIMETLAPEFGITVDVLFRTGGKGYTAEIDEVYGLADALGVDATMELHFNSAQSPLARGTEVLSSGSAGSLAFAKAMQDQLVALFGRTGASNRGVKVLGPNDRGYRSVVAGRAPAILVEPFFGSNAADRVQMGVLGKAALAETYMQAALAYAATMVAKAA